MRGARARCRVLAGGFRSTVTFGAVVPLVPVETLPTFVSFGSFGARGSLFATALERPRLVTAIAAATVARIARMTISAVATAARVTALPRALIATLVVAIVAELAAILITRPVVTRPVVAARVVARSVLPALAALFTCAVRRVRATLAAPLASASVVAVVATRSARGITARVVPEARAFGAAARFVVATIVMPLRVGSARRVRLVRDFVRLVPSFDFVRGRVLTEPTLKFAAPGVVRTVPPTPSATTTSSAPVSASIAMAIATALVSTVTGPVVAIAIELTARRVLTRARPTTLVAPILTVLVTSVETDEAGRNRFRQEQRLAIVEVDTFFPGFRRAHDEHRVLAARAASALTRVVDRPRQVQEPTPSAGEPVLERAFGISSTEPDVEKLGRLPRLSRFDGNRVAVERAHFVTDDLVARTVARGDRGFDVRTLDGLAEALVERANDLVDVAVAMGVELQVELVGLVAQHVRQGTGDPLDQRGVGHAVKQRSKWADARKSAPGPCASCGIRVPGRRERSLYVTSGAVIRRLGRGF